jgi:uncharacterized protein RhaS with RHS repeats
LEGGLNTYGYVEGNPVRWIDSRGLDIEDYEPYEILDDSDSKWYPPGTPGENVDGACWLDCKLKKSAICTGWTMAGSGIGATVGAVASIPSGGAAAPATVHGFAYIGGLAAWGACTFGLDIDCNEQCKKETPSCNDGDK